MCVEGGGGGGGEGRCKGRAASHRNFVGKYNVHVLRRAKTLSVNIVSRASIEQ